MLVTKDKIFSILGVNGTFKIIDEIPFYIISDCDWNKVGGGKLQPTQSFPDGKNSFVMSKKSYFENDKYFWLEHEKGHCEYYFSHPEICKDYLPYPENQVERFAFKKQFTAMKNSGLSQDESFALIKKAYIESEDWEKFPEMNIFLSKIINEVFNFKED